MTKRRSPKQILLRCGSVSASITPQYEKRQKQPEVSQTTSLVFALLSGVILMTIEINDKKITWMTILEKIVAEAWFRNFPKWKFNVGDKTLQPGDVLDLGGSTITISCIKDASSMIFFKLLSGEFLVSVSFESCRSWFDQRVYVRGACFEAHKKLKELGEDGYGTPNTKIHPLLVTYMSNGHEVPCDGEHPYDFHDENGVPFDLDDVLEDPGDGYLTIVVVPKQVYCGTHCDTRICGPLRQGEYPRFYRKKINLCPTCGCLHCPSCGMFGHHVVGTSVCCA